MHDAGVDEKLYSFTYPSPLLQTSSAKTIDSTNTDELPTPYIQLKARLSQAMVNHWTIILVLIIVRLSFAARNLGRNLEQAVTELDVACREVQIAASTAVSMPHYLAQGSNALIQSTINGAVSGSAAVIIDMITAVEAIVLFFIDAFKATYLCLLELAITGTIDAVLDAVEVIDTFVNAALAEIATDLQAGVTDANVAISKVSSIIKEAASVLGLKVTVPTLTLPAISKLTSLQIPSSFNVELESLRGSFSLEAVKNATNEIIELPFEKLKVLVNSSLSGFDFDKELLMIPAKEEVSFCTSENVYEAFDVFRHAVYLTYHILLAALIVMAILAIIPHAYLEWWQWRSLKFNSSFAGASLSAVGTRDATDTVLIASHPIQNYLGIKLSTYFHTQRTKNLVRWYVSFMTHPPVLMLLFFGITGLVACALQALMLASLERAAPTVSQNVANVSSLVMQKLTNSSSVWATHTNDMISNTQLDINRQLFGWVVTSTSAVNDTLTTFTDTLIGTLNTTFGGTILYEPILQVLDCILLLKLKGIETGLTWVHDQAHITLPTVPANVLAMTSDSTNAMFPDVQSTTSARVMHLIQAISKLWRASIRQETLVAGALTAIWFLFAFLALLRCIRDRDRMPTRTAFTSCFLDDLKACISRPKPIAEAPGHTTLDQEWGVRDSLPSLGRMSLGSSSTTEVASDDVQRYGHAQKHFNAREFITVVDAHKSVHGILG